MRFRSQLRARNIRSVVRPEISAVRALVESQNLAKFRFQRGGVVHGTPTTPSSSDGCGSPGSEIVTYRSQTHPTFFDRRGNGQMESRRGPVGWQGLDDSPSPPRRLPVDPPPTDKVEPRSGRAGCAPGSGRCARRCWSCSPLSNSPTSRRCRRPSSSLVSGGCSPSAGLVPTSAAAMLSGRRGAWPSMVTLAIMCLSPPSGLTQPMRRQNSFHRPWRLGGGWAAVGRRQRTRQRHFPDAGVGGRNSGTRPGRSSRRRQDTSALLAHRPGEGRVVWRDGSWELPFLDLAATRAKLRCLGHRLSLRYAF